MLLPVLPELDDYQLEQVAPDLLCFNKRSILSSLPAIPRGATMACTSVSIHACLLLSVLFQVITALPKVPLRLQRPSSAGVPLAIAPLEVVQVEGPPRVAQRIAIIGSGITGASAAFTLAENARQNSKAIVPLITIFEQNHIIGGRITTT